jgi:predicted transport protein
MGASRTPFCPTAGALYQSCVNWNCPRCGRTFRRVKQRHTCGVGSTASLLKGRSPELADLYRKLESEIKRFGDVEVVSRDRYALFRTTRIFVDMTVTKDALRVVVHLGRKTGTSLFVKSGPNGNRISHVAFICTAKDLRAIAPFLREAFELTMREKS